MVTLVCQNLCWYPGRELFSLPGHPIGFFVAARAASNALERHAATRSTPGPGTQFDHDHGQYAVKCSFWFAGGVHAGADAISWAQLLRDAGNDANRAPSRCGRSSLAAHLWPFWPDWSLSHSPGHYPALYDGSSDHGSDVC